MHNNEASPMLDSHNETFAEFLLAELSGDPDSYRAFKKELRTPRTSHADPYALVGGMSSVEVRDPEQEKIDQRVAELQERISTLKTEMEKHQQVLDTFDQIQKEAQQKAEDERSRQRVIEAIADGLTGNSRNK